MFNHKHIKNIIFNELPAILKIICHRRQFIKYSKMKMFTSLLLMQENMSNKKLN